MPRTTTPPPSLALLFAFAVLGPACSDGGPPRPSIVLITLDTTRADHLGCYGYRRATSPRIDALARESTVYERATAVTSWTLPTHASMFTGKLPTSHGARYDAEGPFDLSKAIGDGFEGFRARGIDDRERTLAAILGEAGYRTGAAVAGPWLLSVFGLAQGFDSYDDSGIDHINGRRADSITDAGLAFVDEANDDDAPFFLFLNYFDAHAPYVPPGERYARLFAPGPLTRENVGKPEFQVALYDAEIAFMDEHVGRLLDGLKERGLYDDAWIFVTADHGELLWEIGGLSGHGISLSEPEIHVPLIVKAPGGAAAGREARRVDQTDLLPTILEHLELPLPEGVQGHPLARVAHPIVSEFHPLPPWNDSGDWEALYHGDLKYVWNSAGQGYLADVAADPFEKRDLRGERAEIAQKMETLLKKYLASLPRPGKAGPVKELDEETLRALKGLGYTGDGK
ncbi:MAG: sulfatase [Planctomycetota bacterium JB042]